MKKVFFLLIFCLLLFAQGYATHNRAGEITYESIGLCSNFTFRITITTYTKYCPTCSPVPPDRLQLDSVHMGDDNLRTFPRVSFTDLGDSIRKNIYQRTYSYAGTGTYKIFFIDPNRNQGIANIPGSVNIPFCVSTTLYLHPFFGCNSTPVLKNPPIDKGCVGEIFEHNPFAIDPDGDSLSYQLAVPLVTSTTPVPGYTYPSASTSLTLDPVTGDLVWDTPQSFGEFNIAFYIIEWRNGYPMDTIMRDMQITIRQNCNNDRPQFASLNDTCILAGQTISYSVTASDPNGHDIKLTSSGAPYDVNIVGSPPATFSDPPPSNPVTGVFNWNTLCNHIRPQPYTVFFKAKDTIPSPTTAVQLVDLTSVNIHVIAPPPQGLTAIPLANSIVLNWSPGACATDSGYHIYRRIGFFSGTFDCPCETGVPASSGFVRIATVLGNNNTTYSDAVGNLIVGVQYCYVVTAIFRNGAESCPSNQACALLKEDVPVITHASVLTTSTTTGSVYVEWSFPDAFDQTIYPAPHQYRLFRSQGFTGAAFSATPTAVFNSIYDTTYTDTALNTVDNPYSYKIEFYWDSGGTFIFMGKTEIASTVYLSIAPTDERLNLSWEEHVPWTNHFYEVFRAAVPVPPCYDTTGLIWDSIGRAFTQSFSDGNLFNGVSYRYYVKSVGTYSAPGYDTTRNNSQERCGVPYDNVPPCPPALAVTPDCIEESNLLQWNNPNYSCADDVIQYRIYYRSAFGNEFQLIQTIFSASDTTYIHSGLQSIAGCYYVTALDSNLNESSPSVFACVDTCFIYNIPNVFSPDGDGLNDLLHPCDFTTVAEMQIKCPPYQNVKDVDIKFFNRWGELVFETTDRDIKWNGKHKDTGKDCTDGVYYYTGIVNFIRIEGTTLREIHGFVHIMRKR